MSYRCPGESLPWTDISNGSRSDLWRPGPLVSLASVSRAGGQGTARCSRLEKACSDRLHMGVQGAATDPELAGDSHDTLLRKQGVRRGDLLGGHYGRSTAAATAGSGG